MRYSAIRTYQLFRAFSTQVHLKSKTDSQLIDKLWMRGGFPDSYTASDDVIAMSGVKTSLRPT